MYTNIDVNIQTTNFSSKFIKQGECKLVYCLYRPSTEYKVRLHAKLSLWKNILQTLPMVYQMGILIFSCYLLDRTAYGRTSRVWDSLLAMKSGYAGGPGFAPRPGQYSRESFSSNQETGKVFSPEVPFYSKF